MFRINPTLKSEWRPEVHSRYAEATMRFLLTTLKICSTEARRRRMTVEVGDFTHPMPHAAECSSAPRRATCWSLDHRSK